jgi:putative methyltransferase (TIGR04325 family)
MVVSRDFRIWEGVYRSFAEAPAKGAGFLGEVWLDRSLRTARAALDDRRIGRGLDPSLRQRNAILPPLLATLLGEGKRPRVLDFGGGLGFGFLVVLTTLPNFESVEYHLVENRKICEAGRALFAEFRNLIFHERLPAGPFDVVYSSSALQYIEDWRGLIDSMTRLQAPFLLFSDLFAGPIRSFVTLQTYYDSRIPHWFLSQDEFQTEITRHGYAPILRCDCEARVVTDDGPLPMEHFPEDHRILRSLHLLFVRAPKHS